ncbi:hypothetical protein, partial [Neisseria lactamica]|uniref:hypothetical protein n=1 Tax=Neisseria lactamica TaxID=486 RepID=UPI0027DFE370
MPSETPNRLQTAFIADENRNVIPAKTVAQGGLRPAGSHHLHPKIPSFPRRRESKLVGLQPFPINSCCFSFLDSHFRGNDGGG